MMWVLLVLGGFALLLGIERTLYLHRGQIKAKAFIDGIKNILAKRRLVEALTVCEETPGPVAAVVKAALLHADDSAEAMRFHVQEAAVIELPALERRLGSIAAIAQVAPLVGLLGTVLGMVTTFGVRARWQLCDRRGAFSGDVAGAARDSGQSDARDSGAFGPPFFERPSPRRRA